MSRLGRGFPNNPLLRPPLAAPPAYDAAGAGSAGRTTTWSWNHTIGTGADVWVFINTNTSVSGSTITVTAKIGAGNVPIPQVGAVYDYITGSSFASLFAFSLPNPPTGSQTITVTSSVQSLNSSANSTSYRNVLRSGTPSINSGTGTSVSISAPPTPAVVVMSGFSSNFSGSNATVRSNQPFVSGSALSLLICDSVGVAPVGTFTATLAASTGWGAIAIPLNP